MDTVHYRPYEEEDAPAVRHMLNEAFHVHRYARRPDLLRSALEIFLRDCLVASTWTRVAVVDGQPIGVIMGGVAGAPALGGRTRNRLRLVAHHARIVLTAMTELRPLSRHIAFTRTYARLREDADVELGDQLSLFVVDSAARGTGVGRQLYADFLDHLRDAGRSRFHLFTDTLCSFGFYEGRGMRRAAERRMRLGLDGLPEHIGVYLYVGEVPPDPTA